MGLLHLRGSSLYGSVAPSLPPCPPSSRCGSPSMSTTSRALPSCTESASKSDPSPILYLYLSLSSPTRLTKTLKSFLNLSILPTCIFLLYRRYCDLGVLRALKRYKHLVSSLAFII